MTENDDELYARRQVRGRGTGELAKGRFERLETVYAEEEAQQFETQIFTDYSRSILSFNESPDVGFSASLNPYRGCEHGCIYCYARPTHEYLGLSAGLDFETKIFAKMQAPQLLEDALQAKSWVPQVIGMSGVTDCYQPIERKLELTRACLRVLAEYRNPVVVITKNHLVTRDCDLLEKLACHHAAHVVISLTTLDSTLARAMEPRASPPQRRLEAVRALSAAGIPVSINMAPIIPGLTDHEVPSLLRAAAHAGAVSANYTLIRLPYGVKDLFEAWLEKYYPLRKRKVINRIKDTRAGKLYRSEFGSRMTGEGVYAEYIARIFESAKKRYHLNKEQPRLSTACFRKKPDAQFSLF